MSAISSSDSPFFDVLDLQAQIDVGAEQMLALAEASQRWRMDIVTFGSQQARGSLIAPPAVFMTSRFT